MITNEEKKKIKKLHSKKFRKDYGEFIVEGEKGVMSALVSDYKVSLLIVSEEMRDKFGDLIALAQSNHVSVSWCGNKEAESFKTTDTFPGIMAVVKKKKFKFQGGAVIALDNVKDPGNVGTIVRTADWFGIENILLSEECVDVYNPKVVRSTMGSLFKQSVLDSEDFVGDIIELIEAGYEIAVLDMDGDDINTTDLNNKTVYVFGSESHGVSEEVLKLSNKKLRISGEGSAESLNVAIAAGIVMNKISN